ncbi:DNA methylase [Streptomyces sp. NPDC058335]|uniref:DNA methylase n=1 Tax=Streptomyces sp. NPDC058335 TaxID=3346451 RepID=UPI00365D4D50
MTQPTDIRRDGERPLLLDLFSCASGAAMGYARAGFTVHGCDIASRPNYPFPYHRGDALAYLAHLITTGEIRRYTFAHASPPCQHGCALTVGTNASQGWGHSHVDLVAPTRDLLEQTGLPYVIEQPNGRAEIRKDLTGKPTVPELQAAMGITWTDVREELTEAIPPAYTEHIGRAFLAQVALEVAA